MYDCKPITESIISKFRPTRLYIKELCGVYYFGKSCAKNVEVYSGSGVIWRKRIKKYGKDKIRTIWISDWYYDPQLLQEVAMHFSEENDIVNSSKWANIMPENGLSGGMSADIAKKAHTTSTARMNYRVAAIKRSKDKKYIEKLSAATKKQTNDPAWKEKYSGSGHPKYDHNYYTFQHESGIVEKLQQHQFRSKFNLNSSQLSRLITGKRKKHKGWSIIVVEQFCRE